MEAGLQHCFNIYTSDYLPSREHDMIKLTGAEWNGKIQPTYEV